MLVYFYTFAKKDNSTAQPTGSAVFAPNCVLKDDCSVLHPVIKIANGDGWNPSLYNYCQISDFGRYYFVRDWTQDKNIWYAHCDVDPLASWKTEIGSSTQYVLRSSDEFDGRIRDELYPVTSESVFYSRVSSNLWDVSANGTFILGLLANSGQNSIPGGVNYYALSYNEYKKFMNKCFGLTVADSANMSFMEAGRQIFGYTNPNLTDDALMGLAYAAENPYLDYVDSINWFPFTASIFGTLDTTSGIYLGRNHLSGIQFRTVDPKYNAVYSAEFSSIPKHPQASTRGDFLNAAPYSIYQVYLPRIGLINLDSSLLISYDKLSITLQVDVISGQGQYRLYIGDNAGTVKHLFYTDFIPIGVSIKTASTKQVGETMQAAGNVVQAAAAMNPFSTMASIISLQREVMAPGSGRIGESSGFLGLEGSETDSHGFIMLYSIHYKVADEDNTDNGRPLCRSRVLNTVPGFIQCQHGDLAIAASNEELKAIKSYLEGGFFYE
jgi:hypothetical protein